VNRASWVGLALIVISLGLALRLGPWRLPLAVHHYGGGILWGMMLYALVAAFRLPHWRRRGCLVAAHGVAVCIELTRLVHTPSLDAFRRTLAGQLLLGQLFSGWNVLAYAAGIGVMATLVRPVVRPQRCEPDDPTPVA
jgi:hypothetical protein